MTVGGSKESKIVGELWQALGIDPKTTPESLNIRRDRNGIYVCGGTTAGIGKEIMIIKISLNDVKSINIRQMKEFECGRIEELKRFTEELRECRTKLSKIKFLIPNDAFTKLNNVKTGKPLYFLPPLEGYIRITRSFGRKDGQTCDWSQLAQRYEKYVFSSKRSLNIIWIY